MTSNMGVYLGENLWRSFACGEESFTLLSELYSFSAVPLDVNDTLTFTMSDFLFIFAAEAYPDSERRAARYHEELVSWFESDWLSLEAADALMATDFEDYAHIAPGKLTPHRAVFTLLIFHPYKIHSNWVKRLWIDTLEAHDGDSLAAEVELLFLCEQGQNDHLFMVPKPQEIH
jgi:hypothetical protein